MKILGNRLLVSKVEEEQVEGFKTVEVQDSFVYKGKVEATGWDHLMHLDNISGDFVEHDKDLVGKVVYFAKYSPDTQDIKHEGKDYKIINVDDVLAVL